MSRRCHHIALVVGTNRVSTQTLPTLQVTPSCTSNTTSHNLDPYLEYSNTHLYINFRQLYFKTIKEVHQEVWREEVHKEVGKEVCKEVLNRCGNVVSGIQIIAKNCDNKATKLLNLSRSCLTIVTKMSHSLSQARAMPPPGGNASSCRTSPLTLYWKSLLLQRTKLGLLRTSKAVPALNPLPTNLRCELRRKAESEI